MLEDFGDLGCAYRETDPKRAVLNSVIENLISGQFDRALRVIAFNAGEGWADVSNDVAGELRARSHRERIVFGAGKALRGNLRRSVIARAALLAECRLSSFSSVRKPSYKL